MLAERKAQARIEAREARKALPPAQRREAETRIRAAVRALPEMRAARSVGCYVGVHSEVDTRVLIEELLMDDVRVAVPVVEPPETMRLAAVTTLGDLKPGAHEIPEPPAPHRLLEAVDVVLVPGLLFTPRCERLGNGGGYFDRLLRAMPRATRVGLAYEAQIAPTLPLDDHDEPMDVVVTDAAVRRGPKRPGRALK